MIIKTIAVPDKFEDQIEVLEILKGKITKDVHLTDEQSYMIYLITSMMEAQPALIDVLGGILIKMGSEAFQDPEKLIVKLQKINNLLEN